MNKRDAIQELLDALQHELSEGSVAVVEGPNDKKALEALGISGRAVTISSSTVTSLPQELSAQGVRKAIILTDMDRFGNAAMRRLSDLFQNECIAVDLAFRERFRRLLGTLCFEDLPALIENALSKEKNERW